MEGSHASRSRDTAERDMRRWGGGQRKRRGSLFGCSFLTPAHTFSPHLLFCESIKSLGLARRGVPLQSDAQTSEATGSAAVIGFLEAAEEMRVWYSTSAD